MNSQAIINQIISKANFLNNNQKLQLKQLLVEILTEKKVDILSNQDLIDLFINTKRIEGRSKRTTDYYETELNGIFESIQKPVTEIETIDVRNFLSQYQEENGVSKSTLDNKRRVLSSFFNWLEDEEYILKSPMKRIHKIKSRKKVKKTISDEELVLLRDNVDNLRDKAIIEFLISTGVRVGELVNINKEDIDINNRECVVYGKGDKERIVYFNARTKIYLLNYLESRTDNNPALFVSLRAPFNRIKINTVEKRLRIIGRRLGIENLHPHKLRRTTATMAIDKGMPIEQVKTLLGHEKIDTTMTYAIVKQQNVKFSHSKFLD